MESKGQTWAIDGSFATWKLSIVIEPSHIVDAGEEPPDLVWPADKMQWVANHFGQIVNYCEAVREIEELTGTLRH